MLWHILRLSLKHNVTIAHQDQLIKVNVGIRARLMNCGKYSLAFTSLLDEERDDLVSPEAIETASWLV